MKEDVQQQKQRILEGLWRRNAKRIAKGKARLNIKAIYTIRLRMITTNAAAEVVVHPQSTVPSSRPVGHSVDRIR